MFSVHPIRSAAGGARICRGGALYFAQAPVDGFLCRPQGRGFALVPGPELIEAFGRWADAAAPDDFLTDALRRLSGVDPEDEALLMRAIKLMEVNAPPSALCKLERDLRRRAAICLRRKAGGGRLWMCAACLSIARKGLTQQ